MTFSPNDVILGRGRFLQGLIEYPVEFHSAGDLGILNTARQNCGFFVSLVAGIFVGVFDRFSAGQIFREFQYIIYLKWCKFRGTSDVFQNEQVSTYYHTLTLMGGKQQAASLALGIFLSLVLSSFSMLELTYVRLKLLRLHVSKHDFT